MEFTLSVYLFSLLFDFCRVFAAISDVADFFKEWRSKKDNATI